MKSTKNSKKKPQSQPGSLQNSTSKKVPPIKQVQTPSGNCKHLVFDGVVVPLLPKSQLLKFKPQHSSISVSLPAVKELDTTPQQAGAIASTSKVALQPNLDAELNEEEELDALLGTNVGKHTIPFNGSVATWSSEWQFRLSSNLRHYHMNHSRKGKQREDIIHSDGKITSPTNNPGCTLAQTTNLQRYSTLLDESFGPGDLQRGSGNKPRKSAPPKRHPLQTPSPVVLQSEPTTSSSKATTPALSQDVEEQSNGTRGSGETEVLRAITIRYMGPLGALSSETHPLAKDYQPPYSLSLQLG